jgi:hypothetical protein
MRAMRSLVALSAVVSSRAFVPTANARPAALHLRNLSVRSVSNTACMQASASKRWSFAASMSTEVEGAEAEASAAPTGELTELARLEIRVGKIVEVKHAREAMTVHHSSC